VASLCVPGRGGAGGFVAGMEMLTRGREMLTGGTEMLTRAPLAVFATLDTRAVAAGEGTTAEGIAAAVVVTPPAENRAPVFPKPDPDT
jgi:hypothetical protein